MTKAMVKIIYLLIVCQGKKCKCQLSVYFRTLEIAQRLQYLINKNKITPNKIIFSNNVVFNNMNAAPIAGKRITRTINGAGGCCSRKTAIEGLTL